MGVMIPAAHASDNATESPAVVMPATPNETEEPTDIIPPSNGVTEQPADQEEPAVNEEEQKNEEQPNKSEEEIDNAEQSEQPEQSEESEQSEKPEQTDLEATKPETTENPAEAVGFSITGVTIKDSNGVVIGEGSDDQIDLNAAVEISYNWSLADDHTFQAGSTYEFDIPKAFEIYTTIKNEPLSFDGEEVGTFNVDTQGHVTITFNEFIKNHSQVSGHIGIRTNFSSQIISETNKVEIVFPIADNFVTKTIYFKPAGGTTLTKQGVAEKANKINWSVDVNTALKTIDNAVLSDTIPAGLSLNEDSVQVHHLNVGINSPPTLGELASNYVVKVENDQLQIKFNEPGINSAYRVTYSTPIDPDSELTQFTNKATLTGSNINETTASATVNVHRGALLEKAVESYDGPNQTVHWIIKYNFGQKTIPKQYALLTDRFNGDQELVKDSFKVYRVSADAGSQPNESQLVSNYVLTPITNDDGKNGFNLQFNEDITDAYIIKYATKATERVEGSGLNVSNSVTAIKPDGNGSETKEASQTLGNVIGKKQRGDVDYNLKLVDWNIVINEDNYEMKNVVVRDVFPTGGLKLVQDQLKVLDANGVEVDASNYELEIGGVGEEFGKQGFTLRFKPSYPFNTKHTISYTTEFNNDWKHPHHISNAPAGGEFPNQAMISWGDDANAPKSITVSDTFWPDNLTRNNGAKSGSYDARYKAITWTIKANYNKKELKNAQIIDVIQPNQVYKEGSLHVYKMELLGWWDGTRQGELVDPSQYEVISPTEKNNHTLTVKFKNTINSPYWITFETTLENQVVDKVVSNEVTFKADEYSATWEGSVNIPYGGEYVSKSGVQNDDAIDWTIYINRGQSFIKNAVIYDEPTPNQIVLADSFHLYNAAASADGSLTQTTELVKGEDYTLQLANDGSGQFVLKFTKPIENQAYILKYSSLIHAANGEIVSNKVKFEGDGITVGELTTNKEIIVRSSSGSGSGTGVVGNLEIVKLDKEDQKKSLKGAVFELSDVKGKQVTLQATTDEDGKAIFSKLLYGKYILKEITAPAGYVLDQTQISVTIDKSIKDEGNVLTLTVFNSKKKDPNPPVTPTEPSNPSTPSVPGTPTNPGTPNTPGNPNTQQPTPPSEEPNNNPNPEIVDVDDDEIPLEGVDPSDPLPSDKPNTNKPETKRPNVKTKTSGVTYLPQTGEEIPLVTYGIGFILLTYGLYLRFNVIRNRKK